MGLRKDSNYPLDERHHRSQHLGQPFGTIEDGQVGTTQIETVGDSRAAKKRSRSPPTMAVNYFLMTPP
jgi:hypothetical protein